MQRKNARPPVIGISASVREVNTFPFHGISQRYVQNVIDLGGLPVIVPAYGTAIDPSWMLDRLDGLLLTGCPSNIHPKRYGGPESVPGTLHDPDRDATTLPLIRHAVEQGVPLLAICRGCQELNVAFGGTLHQRLWEVPGRLDHRADRTRPIPERLADRHPVTLSPGGYLRGLIGGLAEHPVNSLHAQGVDRLGEGLEVEALAPDGTVEAIRVAGAVGFALGVQWHAEGSWPAPNALNVAVFHAFAEAATAHAGRAGRRAAAE
ncbi:MAG: gamma-glutamyl-gamma-aminobutyrate hydrolase family protein [Paracoccaceae bacterium]